MNINEAKDAQRLLGVLRQICDGTLASGSIVDAMTAADRLAKRSVDALGAGDVRTGDASDFIWTLYQRET